MRVPKIISEREDFCCQSLVDIEACLLVYPVKPSYLPACTPVFRPLGTFEDLLLMCTRSFRGSHTPKFSLLFLAKLHSIYSFKWGNMNLCVSMKCLKILQLILALT